MHIREEIIRLKEVEKVPLPIVAEEMRLSYWTVRGIWGRYRREGKEGLRWGYDCCGKGRVFPDTLYETAVVLKREHPRWGGGLIRIELEAKHPEESLPCERTLQRWFQVAGVQCLRSRPLSQERDRARKAHEVWQMDAKEQMRVRDGTWHCLLDAVDEASGAVLSTAVFPPAALEPGVGNSGAGGDP